MPQPTENDLWRPAEKKKNWTFLTALEQLMRNTFLYEHLPSLYYNYKTSFSVVLMALVDGEYRFRVVQIGAYSRSSGGGIFAGSTLGRGLGAETVNVPKDEAIPGAENSALPPSPSLVTLHSPSRLIWWGHILVVTCLKRGAFLTTDCHEQGILLEIPLHLWLQVAVLERKWMALCCLPVCSTTFSWNPQKIKDPESQLDHVERMGGDRGGQAAYSAREKLFEYFCAAEGIPLWKTHMVYPQESLPSDV